MEKYTPTKEDITALIDKLFKEPLLSDIQRIQTEGVDAVEFTTITRIGKGQTYFDLQTIAKLVLQEYPPTVLPEYAFIALVAFVSRLRVAIKLAIDNANDISLLEVREALSAAKSVIPNMPKLDEDEDIDQLREQLLKRVEGRNRVLIHRPHPTPHAEYSIPKLMAALAAERTQTPADQITIGKLALRLGCSESAIYKALSRHGIEVGNFLNVPANKWEPKKLDKLDHFLSKID